jgi:hypothetical protein
VTEKSRAPRTTPHDLTPHRSPDAAAESPKEPRPEPPGRPAMDRARTGRSEVHTGPEKARCGVGQTGGPKEPGSSLDPTSDRDRPPGGPEERTGAGPMRRRASAFGPDHARPHQPVKHHPGWCGRARGGPKPVAVKPPVSVPCPVVRPLGVDPDRSAGRGALGPDRDSWGLRSRPESTR